MSHLYYSRYDPRKAKHIPSRQCLTLVNEVEFGTWLVNIFSITRTSYLKIPRTLHLEEGKVDLSKTSIYLNVTNAPLTMLLKI